MRRPFTWMWNAGLELAGRLAGRILRILVRWGWIHFSFASEALSALPFSPGWKLRSWVYSEVLPKFGSDVVLHFGVVIADPRTTFGSDVWVSYGAYIDYAEIGSSVLVGPYACLLAGGRHHKFDRTDLPIKSQGNPDKVAVTIGSGAWIGAGAIVMASIGRDAIVGAGSVVTREIPPFAVAAGNPARVLRIRANAGEKPPNRGSQE